MFGLSQLSILQFPAFTISAAGQEVWEGDIIQLNQLLLLDTLTGTESHCLFLPTLRRPVRRRLGCGWPTCPQGLGWNCSPTFQELEGAFSWRNLSSRLLKLREQSALEGKEDSQEGHPIPLFHLPLAL